MRAVSFVGLTHAPPPPRFFCSLFLVVIVVIVVIIATIVIAVVMMVSCGTVSYRVVLLDQGEHVDVPGLPPHPRACHPYAGSLVYAGTVNLSQSVVVRMA